MDILSLGLRRFLKIFTAQYYYCNWASLKMAILLPFGPQGLRIFYNIAIWTLVSCKKYKINNRGIVM